MWFALLLVTLDKFTAKINIYKTPKLLYIDYILKMYKMQLLQEQMEGLELLEALRNF